MTASNKETTLSKKMINKVTAIGLEKDLPELEKAIKALKLKDTLETPFPSLDYGLKDYLDILNKKKSDKNRVVLSLAINPDYKIPGEIFSKSYKEKNSNKFLHTNFYSEKTIKKIAKEYGYDCKIINNGKKLLRLVVLSAKAVTEG